MRNNTSKFQDFAEYRMNFFNFENTGLNTHRCKNPYIYTGGIPKLIPHTRSSSFQIVITDGDVKQQINLYVAS